jgi:hypothetical protein
VASRPATRVSPQRLSPSLAAAAQALEWLPALTAAVYVGLVAVSFPALTRALSWNSDAAGAFVIGELAHAHDAVEIPRFGWWSSLWWLLATRGLPGHEHLWEATGYVFALATAALVGWATARVAGRWAGATAAATTVVVGPKTLTSLLTVNFHTSTPFTAAILALYVTVLTRRRSWALAAAVGVVAGVNAASDRLLWIAGIAPFAIAAAVVAVAGKRRDAAERAAVVLGIAAVCSVVTDRVMSGLGFHVIPAGVQPVGLTGLLDNLDELGKSIALVVGANFLSYPTYPADPLRYLVALLGLLAVAAALFTAVTITRRRSEPILLAYAWFWASTAVLVTGAYWVSNLASSGGPGGGLNYMLTLPAAAGVGVALVARGSPARRLAVGAAITVLGAVNIAGIANGRAEEPVSAQGAGPKIVRLLERKGLTHGYAPYWDAQSLTWHSGTKVVVAPVRACNAPPNTLCRERFFTIGSWYEPRSGPSFLVVDAAAGLWKKPSPALGRPSEVHRFTEDADVIVYVYPYDIARHIAR